MTKIDLITGILGSGKTTFIRKYARYLTGLGLRIAILENDFGAVNVDMMLLNDLKSENCVLEMIVGGGDADCHKRRFKTQLIALGMQHFDRIIVEPSGIFDMDEFFDTLYEPPLDRWLEVGSVISVVDSGMEDSLSEQMEYLFASEAACAGKLVMSKCETAPLPEKDNIARILSLLGRCCADMGCRRSFSEKDVICRDWNGWEDMSDVMNAGYRSESYIKRFSRDDIISMTHYFMNIRMDEGKLPELIDGILSDPACGHIHRIKGFTEGQDGWLKINSVGGRTEIAPIVNGQSVFIVIGDHVDRNAVDEHFMRYNTDEKYTSI